MAKKIFVPRVSIRKGERWAVDYEVFDPNTGEKARHRNEFGLNDVPEQFREYVADCLVNCVEKVLRTIVKPAPVAPVANEIATQEQTGIMEAVALAVQVKCSGSRTNTHKNYLSIGKFLATWLALRSYNRMPAGEFSKRHARAFFDWYMTRKKLRGITLNNRITHLRALWYVLIDREICTTNPWLSIRPFREEEKYRRAFTPEERRIVAAEVMATDYWLFRALLLQYYCFIRPEELRRMKFRAFDFARGVVKVDSTEAKKWKTRWATIPRSVMPYFLDGVFDQQPANFHVFGIRGNRSRGYSLGASPNPASKSVAYRMHKRIIDRLRASGKLADTFGLTWYSWKDTGITDHTGKTSPLSTRDQAGHEHFDQTLAYYQQASVNQEYAGLKNDLLT